MAGSDFEIEKAARLILVVFLPLLGSWRSLPSRYGLPVPDRLVVLTFDDGTKSDITYVAPLLKSYGFGASFYVTEGLRDIKRQDDALTWDDISELNKEGFEIGNHTDNHLDLTRLSKGQVLEEIEGLERRCKDHGIPLPTTFVYPGFQDDLQIAEILLKKGYSFARRGVRPEFQDGGTGGRGPAYDPAKHHPLFVPTTGYAGPGWQFKDLVWAIDQAKNGKIAVLTFHGVPYPRAPWVSVDPKVFAGYIRYLHDRKCTVIAMRDLDKYVKPATLTAIPLRRETGD
jgi:peptidoglycan/xylan/chitin deacetylase (PgdA/CDA1 family)